MDNELELTDRCKRGEVTAFKEVYDEYAGSLLAVCLRYVGNQMDAEDILHDAFLKIFRSFDKFTYQGKGSLKAWLYRIVINEALEFLRGLKSGEKDVEDVDKLDIDIEDESESEEPDTNDMNSLSQEQLMRFIKELPTGYRTVFNLYVFENKSHKEIGELLGITERSSSSQFSRARRILRTKIMEYLNNSKNEKG